MEKIARFLLVLLVLAGFVPAPSAFADGPGCGPIACKPTK